jgi:hypothetical protein
MQQLYLFAFAIKASFIIEGKKRIIKCRVEQKASYSSLQKVKML